MSDDTQRTLGRHDAAIDGIQGRLEEVERKLDCVLQTLHEARGGWRALMLVAGIAGAVGAGLSKLAAVLGWFPK